MSEPNQITKIPIISLLRRRKKDKKKDFGKNRTTKRTINDRNWNKKQNNLALKTTVATK